MIDLLEPRFKVIESYPFNHHFKIGEVICLNEVDDREHLTVKENYVRQPSHHNSETNQDYCTFYESEFKKYPHIFRKMDWKEGRTESEMPKYLKFVNEDGKLDFVLKVEKYINDTRANQIWAFIYLWKDEPDMKRMSLQGWIPATLEEYQSQKL